MSGLEMSTEHAAFMGALAYDGFVALGGPVGNGARILLISTPRMRRPSARGSTPRCERWSSAG
jgi:hypothetical protein